MGNVFFSSDFHFGHSNIAGPSVSNWSSGYRNFNSVDSMNEAIVNSCSHLKEGDSLYFMGDWAFGGHHNIPKLRKEIKCKNVYVTLGNHDKNIFKYSDLFTWIKPVWEGKILDRYFFLHHYAQRIWNLSHRSAIHLYGHSHGTLPDDSNNLSMDVGWDTCLFGHAIHTLYHYDEIIDIMNKKKNIPVDHHNPQTTT